MRRNSEMKILVLGGAGFFGSAVTEKFLEYGHNVVIVDNLCMGNKLSFETMKKVEFHENDAGCMELIPKLAKKVDGIVNLASVVGVDVVTENELRQMDNEVDIIRASVKASSSNDKLPIIYASSSSVYGSMNQGIAAYEKMPIAGSSSYSIAKAWGEKYYKCCSEKEGINVIVLRPFNLYGKKQDARMVIPRFINAALSETDLTVYGDGKQTRDFTYVDDVAESIVNMMEKAQGSQLAPYQEINCCTGVETTIATIAQMVIELTGSRQSKIIYETLPSSRKDYEVQRRFGDNNLFRKITRRNTFTSLDKGLSEVISFWKSEREFLEGKSKRG